MPTPTATLEPTPTPLAPGLESYVDERLGFTFSYPIDWTITTSDPTFIQANTGFGGLFLVISEFTGPTTLESELVQLVSEVSGFRDYQEIFTERIDGEIPRYIFSAQWSGEVSAVRGDFLVTVGGARTFVVAAIARDEVFEGNQAEYAQVFDSFKITLRPAADVIDNGAGTERILNAIGERTALIRGLVAPAALERSTRTREEFVVDSAEELLDEDTVSELERLKELCVVLDLCEESDDLSKSLLAMLGQGVLGFYKSGEQSLTVVTDGESLDSLAWLTYAHEYTHALQDQQFGLSALVVCLPNGFTIRQRSTWPPGLPPLPMGED